MADFSIVSDTSTTLLRLLRENMCPDPIQSPEAITLATPVDKNSDFQLGIFLYDMKDLSEYRESGRLRGDTTLSYPPRPLTLTYLLFINNKAQVSTGAEIEQRIFGRAYQVLMDNSVLNIAAVNPFVAEGEEETRISILNPTFEDKTKIWSALSLPLQLAVYLSVSPVPITPRRERVFTRVVASSFDTQIMNHTNGKRDGTVAWPPGEERDA